MTVTAFIVYAIFRIYGTIYCGNNHNDLSLFFSCHADMHYRTMGERHWCRLSRSHRLLTVPKVSSFYLTTCWSLSIRRLAFVTLKNNLMVLSLRAMMMQFVALMLIAAFCFCGFLYALWT